MGINGQQAGNITLELFDEVSRGASKNFQLSGGGDYLRTYYWEEKRVLKNVFMASFDIIL